VIDGTVEGGVYGDYVTGTGGSDDITINGIVKGEVWGDDATVDGGDDTITVNGEVGYDVYGDGVDGYGGEDVIIINGYVGRDVFGDYISNKFSSDGADDVIVVSSTGIVEGSVEGDWAYGFGGNDSITVDGYVGGYVVGDDTTNDGGDDVITINGIVEGFVSGDYTNYGGGNDTIIINGSVGGYVAGDDSGGCGGDDLIIINGHVAGDVYGDFDGCGHPGVAPSAVAIGGGNDTVVLGAGSVSYSTQCESFSVTTVNYDPATVAGIIDGDASYVNGYDTLVFSILAANDEEVDALDAYLASLGGNAQGHINGVDYTWTNFEAYDIYATVFDQGATKMYDDGVTLAFALADGIQVCNGPSGLKAGLIDYGRLTAGQREFGDNGFIVTLEDLGSQHFKVHVWKDGVEQFDDANNDGVADDLFVFGF